jgi:4-hydroxy-3-polyprenylbenzoate decarboxylase
MPLTNSPGATLAPPHEPAPSLLPDTGPTPRAETTPAPTQPSATPHTLVLAITGASGSILAAEMLRALDHDSRVAHVHLVVSPSALRVLAEESTPSPNALNSQAARNSPNALNSQAARSSLASKLLGHDSPKITTHAHENIGASIASGSFPISAMIVLPCSMGTLAGISHGLAGNLIERAADVCLKERRPLILCVRETPLNLIHIRNMAAVTEAGATVFPVIPTFYNHPHTTDDIARNFVHRVLQHIGLPQPNAFTWGKD